MAKTVTRAHQIGGSMVVSLPREVVEEEGIRDEELVELKVKKARGSQLGRASRPTPMLREDEASTRRQPLR